MKSLQLFSDPAIFSRLDRPMLQRLLEEHRHCLPPQAIALLTASPNYEEYCAAWPPLFSSLDAFGQPLRQVLIDIETLALPENQALLNQALTHLPPGFQVLRWRHPLHESLHLWLIAQGDYGITFPIPPPSGAEDNSLSPIENQKSEIENPLEGNQSLAESLHNGATEINPAESPPIGSDNSLSSIENRKPKIENPPAPSSIENQKSKIENPSQALARLAKLSPLDYDLVRRAEAKRLHLRLRTLDDAVQRARALDDEAQADTVQLHQLIPWPEPISDAPALFDHVHDRALLYLHLPPGAAVVLALWPPHAHAIRAFTQTPRLNFTSSEPGCGKSTALSFLTTLSPKGLRTDNLKTAVLFRIVERYQPTLLLDEVDSYLHLYPDLRGLLNAGHDPDACVHRCEGHHVRAFKSFAATALAGLGHLTPTLRDRSIIIPLSKAPPGSLQLRFDKRRLDTENLLGCKIARWTQDNFDAIASCDPPLPACNRLADNWRPLFAVAHIIGGHWPDRAFQAFQHLHRQPAPSQTQPADPDSNRQLLEDIRTIFAQSGTSRLFSSQIVAALHALPNRPWSQPPGSNQPPSPMSVGWLARRLTALGVSSRNLRIGDRQAKGYNLADFDLPLARYLNGDSTTNGSTTA
jgi:hypothetical protein